MVHIHLSRQSICIHKINLLLKVYSPVGEETHMSNWSTEVPQERCSEFCEPVYGRDWWRGWREILVNKWLRGRWSLENGQDSQQIETRLVSITNLYLRVLDTKKAVGKFKKRMRLWEWKICKELMEQGIARFRDRPKTAPGYYRDGFIIHQ